MTGITLEGGVKITQRLPFGAIEPRFAIGLGCEIKYAKRLIYALQRA
jgi:predicted transcriptional regulator